MTYEKVKSDPDVLDMVLSPWTYRAMLELFSNSLLNKVISFRVNLRCSFVHQDDLVSATQGTCQTKQLSFSKTKILSVCLTGVIN
jgi:hypothetical protein